MPVTRRDFLSSTAAAGAVIAGAHAVPGLWLRAAAAAPTEANDNVLVVLQLSGGNDGLNTVVPYADDAYQSNRYTLRISADQVHRMDEYVGFHPALRGFAKLYEEEQVAVVQGVGYPNPNRSHFESMDIWHTAMQSSGARQVGWLGRWLDSNYATAEAAADVPGVHFGSDVQPLAMAGLKVHVPSIASIEEFRLRGVDDAAQQRAIEQAIGASRGERGELLAFLHDTSQSALVASRRIQQAIGRNETSVTYPPTELAQRLQGVAQLIDAGLATRLYYVTLDGFDTHSRQSEAHAALLTDMSEALSAFLQDLKERDQSQRVLVMCFSEFGRRVKENGSQGTDHGAAAPMFIAGGRVRPGLVGEHPSLTDLVDGDLKYHTDFRQVYATVLDDWLGADSKDLLADQFDKLPLLATS